MGAWEEIVDFTVPSNTTSVTFNNFGTITKDDFIKITKTFINPNSTDSDIYLFANNDTNNSNYFFQALRANGSSVVAERTNRSRIAFSIGNQTETSLSYLKISQNDKLNAFSNLPLRNDSLLFNSFQYTTSINSFSSGITSLTFTASETNGLGANSRIQIYRLTAEKVADVLVNSNSTQVDITGLDIKKGDEYLLVSDYLFGTNPSNIDLRLFINDNTTPTNYYSQVIGATGSSSFSVRLNTALFVGTSNSISSVAYSHIKLSNIGAFTAQHYELRSNGSSLPIVDNAFVSSTAENLTSLNKINIVSSLSNAIGTGSRFQLYKLYEGGN